MSFFYDLNKKLDSIRATPEVTHKQLNERDMKKTGKLEEEGFPRIQAAIQKYTQKGVNKLAKLGSEGASKAKMAATRKEFNQYDNKEVDEGVMDTVKSVGKKVASGVNRLVGHGSDEEMRKDVQRKSGAPVTGKKPSAAPKQTPIDPKDEYDYFTGRDKVRGGEQQQKTSEAAKYRDPKYKDKLYTQEPPDYTYGPDMDDAYDNPKPDDYEGRKRKIGGGEFSHNDPLRKGFGRGGASNSINTHGKRKGMPSRDQITSLKGSIKDASGTHSKPNLPEMDSSDAASDAREAMAKQIYDLTMLINTNDKMYAQDSPQDTAKLQKLQAEFARLYPGEDGFKVGSRFHNSEYERGQRQKQSQPVAPKPTGIMQKAKNAVSGMFKEDDMPMTAAGKKLNFADKIANAKKEVDEMLGDVAAEAMRSALSPKQKKIAGMAGDPNKIGADDLAALRKGRNAEMDEERSKGTAFDMSTRKVDTPKAGSTERGAKHDIKHSTSDPRYTGRTVTRRTDAQGISVGADDDSDTQAGPRGRGRPKGTKGAIGAKGPSGRSKLMTKEGADQGQAQQVVDDLAELRAAAKQAQRGGEFPQGFASQLEVVLYAAMTLIKNQQSGDAQVREEELDEKAVSKQQQKFMGMAHAMQKGEKVKGASKELKNVAKTMKPKDTEDFAKTKHKGLPDKAKSKKKEEEVEESTTSGSVATSTATTGGKGGVYGKGIYDSMNRELEQMIAESMTINMSDSTEGGKSLTITATDEDALKLGMLLKNAGLGGGDQHGDHMHSHGEEPCDTCGMQDCGCGDVQEAVDENAPDWPTNTEQANNNFGYAGGLNKPKTDVAGDGQSTVPVVAAHTQDEDALRRMMEMAGIKKKEVDEEKTDEGNKFAFNVLKAKEAGKKEADLDGDGDMEKVRESIFALNNQWQAYKG